jgi:hypothetical protein
MEDSEGEHCAMTLYFRIEAYGSFSQKNIKGYLLKRIYGNSNLGYQLQAAVRSAALLR